MSANDYQFSPPECHDVTLSALCLYTHGSVAMSVPVGSYVVVSHGVVFGDYRYYAMPYIERVLSSLDDAVSVRDWRVMFDSLYYSNHESPYRYEYEIWHVVPDAGASLLDESYISALFEYACVIAHV